MKTVTSTIGFLFLIIAISSLFSGVLSISLNNNYCSDPLHDNCNLIFSLASSDRRNQTYTYTPSNNWLSYVQSISSPTNECSMGENGTTLLITPRSYLSVTTPPPISISCTITIKPNIVIPSSVDSTSGLVFPALVYYQQQFDLMSKSTSCATHTTNEPCLATLSFPTAALPFTLKTTNTMVLDQLECLGDDGSIISRANQLGIVKKGDNVNGVDTYEFKFSSTPLPSTATSIRCTTYFSKSIISPYFYITSQTNGIPLYSSNLIIYNDMIIRKYRDCLDPTSNSCTLLYEINPLIQTIPTNAIALGFISSLTSPSLCSSEYGAPLTQGYILVCHTFLKHLQSAVPLSQPVEFYPAVTSNQITFYGANYDGLKLSYPISDIVYTRPLIYSFDETVCNDQYSPYCPLTVQSLHTGPEIKVRIPLPYSGIVNPDPQCSEWMQWDQREGLIRLPGSRSRATQVPHPYDAYRTASTTLNDNLYHYCTLLLLKTPLGAYTTTTVHPITLFTQAPAIITNSLHPDSDLVAVPAKSYLGFPMIITTGSDCTEQNVEWCTVTFTPDSTHSTVPLRSFSFSANGISTPILEGDWSMSKSDGDDFFQMSIDYRTSIWYHVSNPSSDLLGLPHNCNPSQLQRCKSAPRAVATSCISPCDPLNPDSLTNPCVRCQESVNIFTVSIIGIVTEPMVFKYRKLVWNINYKNTIYLYSYNNLDFEGGIRLGNNDLNPSDFTPHTTNLNTVSVTHNPPYSVTYGSDCANPNYSSCAVVVSRRDSTIKVLWSSFAQSDFVKESTAITTGTVWDPAGGNDGNGALLTINLSLIPGGTVYDLALDFPVSFLKHLGVNSILRAYRYIVDTCPPGVGPGDATPCIVGPRSEFSHQLRYDQDGLPSFDPNCHSTSSESCTITYKFNSAVTAYTSTLIQCYGVEPPPAACYTPVTIISHYVPNAAFIHSFGFVTKPKNTYLTTHSSAAGIRDPTKLYEPTFEPTCTGQLMDSEVLVDMVWDKGCLSTDPEGTCVPIIEPLTNTSLGKLTFVLKRGAFPLGGSCVIKMIKKSVAAPSKRIRALPLNLLGQDSTTFRHTTASHSITFPVIQWTRLSMTPRSDCTTQNDRAVVCTIDIKLHSSPENQLQKLNITVPSVLRHPLILVSDEPYYLLQTLSTGEKIKVGDVTVQYAPETTTVPFILTDYERENGYEYPINTKFNEDGEVIENQQIGDDNNNNNDNEIPFTSPMTTAQTELPTRYLNVNIYPGYQDRDVECQVILQAPVGYEGDPVPFGAFPISFFLNGVYSNSKTLPFANFPSSITGVLFLVNSNVTVATSYQPWTRIDFSFNYDKLLKIVIDQDFNAYDTNIPCYQRNAADQHVTREQFDSHYEDATNKIMAWLKTDKTTKKTTLTPINPAAMPKQVCYTYYRTSRLTKSENVEHKIDVVAVNNPAMHFNVDYYGSYPTYSTSALIAPITEADLPKDSSGQTGNDNNATIQNGFGIILVVVIMVITIVL